MCAGTAAACLTGGVPQVVIPYCLDHHFWAWRMRELGVAPPSIDSTAILRTDALLRGFEQSLPEAERRAVSFYFSLGSQNQDPRGLALDGEATLIVSGFHAAAGLADLYFVMARSTWVATSADLDRVLPPPTSRLAKLARRVRGAF